MTRPLPPQTEPRSSASFMRSRQNLVEIFSTFVQFESDSFGGWMTDARLRRSMQHCLKQTIPDNSEKFWAIYWHKIWQTQSSDLASDLAKAHISAYLQEVCFWVARKMSLNLGGRQSPADLFQTAIVRIGHVLKGFNPQLSSNLKSYAELTFGNIIKDTLRKQQEADICTDWALLRKVTRKRLLESLTAAGLDAPTIANYLQAWTCFNELYAAADGRNSRKLTKPEAATWQAIAKLYSTETGTSCPPERLEQWMLSAARAVRSFLYPSPMSIDAPTSSDEDAVSLLERLPGDDSLLTELMQQEERGDREAQLAQIGNVLQEAIADLDAQTQQILAAYYRQEFTQQQIAQQLGIQQYTISRRLTSARQTLVKKIARWSQETLHITLTSDVLNGMSAVLDEWLTVHYRHSDSSQEYL